MKFFHKRKPTDFDTERIVTSFPPCDFCRQSFNILFQAAHYHGMTQFGEANMCDDHFKSYGLGLGHGKGQRLVLQGRRE